MTRRDAGLLVPRPELFIPLLLHGNLLLLVGVGGRKVYTVAPGLARD